MASPTRRAHVHRVPQAQWQKNRPTIRDRLTKEIKHRADAVELFPTHKRSCGRLPPS